MKVSLMICLAMLALPACKKKVVTTEDTAASSRSSENAAALIPAGDWQGIQDKIDASLGSVKDLD